MFNMWNRTYVQTFNQRSIFGSKTILADHSWSKVVFGEDNFKDGGELIAQEWDLDDVVNKKYDGQYSNLLIEMMSDKDSKWAVVVTPNDYYKMLAYYLKELQHSFKLTDFDLHTIAYTFMYNNFYYGSDQAFVDGFVSQVFQQIMKNVFRDYTPVGVLDMLDASALPTEIAYMLVHRDLIPETAIQPKLVNAAKMIITRLWQVHLNDFSEWLILDTKQFLNLMKSPTTAEVVTDDFSMPDMLNMMASDEYLSSMFFTSFPFYSAPSNWETDDNFRVEANRLLGAWEGLANYLVQRGIDSTWAELRHSQYAEIILRYEYVVGTVAAVRFILQLDGAPEHLDKPVLDMLGYDILSECFDSKYNKTLLLVTLRGMSDTYKGFIENAFKEPEVKEIAPSE